MAVRMRLKRLGRKNRSFFRLGVFDSGTRRDGRAIEELGHYDPLIEKEEGKYQLNRERIQYWLGVGALPTETVQSILLKQGIDVPTSGKARGLTPEERVEREKERERKRQQRELAKARKEAVGTTSKPMSKKERREARKAGGL